VLRRVPAIAPRHPSRPSHSRQDSHTHELMADWVRGLGAGDVHNFERELTTAPPRVRRPESTPNVR